VLWAPEIGDCRRDTFSRRLARSFATADLPRQPEKFTECAQRLFTNDKSDTSLFFTGGDDALKILGAFLLVNTETFFEHGFANLGHAPGLLLGDALKSILQV
jgi:hypothetical protein